MAKKKVLIYSTIGIIFTAIFFLYVLNVLNSQNRAHTERLQENLTIWNEQMQKNMELRAQSLKLDFRGERNYDDNDLKDVIQCVEGYQSEGSVLYVADDRGTVYRCDGTDTGITIDKAYFQEASAKGYVAKKVNIQDSQPQIAFMTPVSSASPYYYVEIYTAEKFAWLLWGNFPLTGRAFVLFDNTGTPFFEYSRNGEESPLNQKLLDNAVNYVYLGTSEPIIYHQQGIGQYTAYMKVSQPQNWFVGKHVDYSTDDFQNVVSTAVIMLILFILILATIITLDVINDKVKRKELFLVKSVDQLTGLLNAAGMQEGINAFIQQNTGGLSGYSLVCMDVVEFSRINAMFGYSIGDILLRTVADVIKESFFCGSRTNADHFTFLANTKPDIVMQIEDSLHKAIKSNLGNEYLQMVSFKFGIYPVQSAKANFREVYDGALMALKDAKKKNGNKEVIYDMNLQKTLELKKQIEMNMLHALSKEEFLVYVQPQIQIADGSCARGEALVRWDSELIGFLSPDTFIPIFESNGFIIETDFYVLDKVLSMLSKRMEAGLFVPTIAVNQSRVTLSFPNYFEKLKSLVEKYSVPLNCIELEITESTLENNLEGILPLLHRMKGMGFTVSMDDFGAGYSSLNTLRLLPIDILKIDRAFLAESDTSERSKQIICSIIEMAKALNIEVVCEGVETKDQLDFLRSAQCDIAQGFYFSKPIPMNDYIAKYLDIE